jgi:hypothetical protein
MTGSTSGTVSEVAIAICERVNLRLIPERGF